MLSNSAFLESNEGLRARTQEIDQINAHFEEIIGEILDPGKAEREQRQLEENPLFSAGIRGLERLKWEFAGAQQQAAELRAQGL